MPKTGELILRSLVGLLELLIKKTGGPSNWKPGTPSFQSAIISILYVSHHQEKAKQLFGIVESLGFKPQRIKLNPEDSEYELTSQMIRTSEGSWASILIDPCNPKANQVAHAFRNFAHKRTDVVAIVAGDRPSSVEVLDRYTHLKILPESAPTRQETTETVMKASLARVRHYRRLGSSFVVLFFLAILSVFILGSALGWWFARDRAVNTLQSVRSFDAALVKTFSKKGKTQELVVLAKNRDDDEIKNSEATKFESHNGNEFSCKLLYVEFIDKLIQTDHKWGALCPSNRSHGGERGYVADNLSTILKKTDITEAQFRDNFQPILKERLDKFLRPLRGEKSFLPTVLFIEVDTVPEGKKIDAEWKVISGKTLKNKNKVIVMAFEGSQVIYDGKEVFTIKRISRASTLRLCALK